MSSNGAQIANNGIERIRFLRSLVIIFVVFGIGLVNASGSSAQWPSYGFGSSLGSSFFSFTPTYGNPFTSALSFPSALSSPYSNSSSLTFSLSLSPSSSFSSRTGFGGLYGGPNGGLYAGSTSYSTFSPGVFSPFASLTYYGAPAYSLPAMIPPVWQGPLQGGTIFSPVVTVTAGNSWPGVSPIVSIPHPANYGETKPAPAPWEGEGEWQSRRITNADGEAAQGKLVLDTVDDQKVLEMENSPLATDSGLMTQSQYTPTSGKAPISFKAEFPPGYIAEFTGTANNTRCPLNVYCAFAGNFDIEGEYVIKDDLGRVADQGTFNLKWPVYHYVPPKPVAAIQELGSPNGRDILSLTTGPDGRIYGGTDNGSREGCMFVYDPATEKITELGKPGYECAAMVTGPDGLIYIGGGTKYLSQSYAKGYANFAIYDPGKSWNPGTGPDANPRDLGQVVGYTEEKDLTGIPIIIKDLAAAPDGKIYGGTGWKNLGPGDHYAHLFVYDPATDKITYLGQPIPQQGSINSLTMASNGILYGVVQAAPVNSYKRPAGKIFTYNPVDKSFTIIDPGADPNPVDEGVLKLTIGKDGLIYAAGMDDINRIFSYDPVSHTYDSKGRLGGCAEVLDMLCTDDGIIYMGCAVNGYLVQYDPAGPFAERPYDDAQDKPGVNPRMFHHTGKVSALTVGQDGYIYFGTLDGKLFVYTGEE